MYVLPTHYVLSVRFTQPTRCPNVSTTTILHLFVCLCSSYPRLLRIRLRNYNCVFAQLEDQFSYTHHLISNKSVVTEQLGSLSSAYLAVPSGDIGGMLLDGAYS